MNAIRIRVTDDAALVMRGKEQIGVIDEICLNPTSQVFARQYTYIVRVMDRPVFRTRSYDKAKQYARQD